MRHAQLRSQTMRLPAVLRKPLPCLRPHRKPLTDGVGHLTTASGRRGNCQTPRPLVSVRPRDPVKHPYRQARRTTWRSRECEAKGAFRHETRSLPSCRYRFRSIVCAAPPVQSRSLRQPQAESGKCAELAVCCAVSRISRPFPPHRARWTHSSSFVSKPAESPVKIPMPTTDNPEPGSRWLTQRRRDCISIFVYRYHLWFGHPDYRPGEEPLSVFGESTKTSMANG